MASNAPSVPKVINVNVGVLGCIIHIFVLYDKY